jgi:hypothetical protein
MPLKASAFFVTSKMLTQATVFERFVVLGFVGDGLFRGLYWEKTYLCSRNRETEGSAQAGGLRQKHKRQNPINN